jgi:hypothetical protein
METCDTCDYRVENSCHRYPPVVIGSTKRTRPRVDENTIACGEYKKRKRGK